MEHDSADAPAPVTPASAFESPAPIWWILIPLGLALTALLALSPAAHGMLPAPLDSWLPIGVVRLIFAAALLAHVLEGGYALSRARAAGLPAGRWGAQTLLLGYPSLRLLLRRTGRTA